MNQKDPLLKTGPDQQRELFMMFAKVSNGYSSEDVIGAAINLLVNGIRQAHATRDKAILSMDEKMAKAKEILATHYDSAGRKNGIFPFHQIIKVEHFIDTDR